MENNNQNQKGYGYGKKSIWYWVVIYIIVGAVVYGAIYYYLMKKGSYNAQAPQYNAGEQNYNPQQNQGGNPYQGY